MNKKGDEIELYLDPRNNIGLTGRKVKLINRLEVKALTEKWMVKYLNDKGKGKYGVELIKREWN